MGQSHSQSRQNSSSLASSTISTANSHSSSSSFSTGSGSGSFRGFNRVGSGFFKNRRSSGNSQTQPGYSRHSSIVQEFSSIVKFVQSNSIAGEFSSGVAPKTSARRAFKRFVEANRPSVKKRLKKNEGEEKKTEKLVSKTDTEKMASSSTSTSTTPAIFKLTEDEVLLVKRTWPKLENCLLPIGIRVFISILEARTEKNPVVCKQKTCCNNKESPKTKSCPTQLMLNEELQKFVLLLMGVIRRTVKHIDSQAAVCKLLHKCGRKHFDKFNFDLSKLDPDPLATHFCTALKDFVTFNDEIMQAYNNLVRAIVTTVQRLDELRDFELEEAANVSIDSSATTTTADSSTTSSSDRESNLSSPSATTKQQQQQHSQHVKQPQTPIVLPALSSAGATLASFDRQLVLFGAQTFQDFFDLQPHLLNYFDQFSGFRLNDRVPVSDALKMHASRVLELVEDIVGSSGDPDKVRALLQDLGKRHRKRGITEEQLDMLGPLVCHTVRPLVFRSGLWSIEIEKSWTHLFDMVAVLMKRAYPNPEETTASNYTSPNNHPFPTLTQVIILKDTWTSIVEQMHDLGLAAVIKLFKINYNMKFYTSPKVRYRPNIQQQQQQAKKQGQPEPQQPKPQQQGDNEHLTVLFNLLISIVDTMIAALPCTADKMDSSAGIFPPQTLKQMDLLREPMDWIGPVFCNTVRPLLLVQGKWSYPVEMSWLLMFRQLVKKKYTTERMTRRERYT